MDSIGPKVEAFYIALSRQSPDPDQQIEAVVNCMHAIENHEPNAQMGENDDVILEISKDCQKKCAQFLRAPFAETIRNIIAACRKRLASKAALDSEASYQHHQRHLNALIEVLGTWSNVVAQCTEFGFSRSLTRQILSPLYTRIVEASQECFKAFKRDKELDQWSSRLLDESVECNVASLDSLVSQVAAFRSMVHQHYCYHYSCFRAYRLGLDRDSDREGGHGSPAVVESMLVVTPEELLQWRELDAQYVTMEFGFLQRATQQALSEAALIEVEDGVYIPQCVEDVFFLLGKVCERALGTGSESNLFSVGNRIVELIRYTAPDEFDRHSVLYRVVCSKALYRQCVARKEVSPEAMRRILEGGGRRRQQQAQLHRTASGSGFGGSAASSAYSTPSKGPPAGNQTASNSGTGRDSAEGSSSSAFSTPGKTLVDVVSQTALGSIFLGTGGDSNSGSSGSGGSEGGSGTAATSAATSAYFTPTIPSIPSSPALSDLFSESTAASLNSWFVDQLSPYLAASDSATNGSSSGGGVTAAGKGGGADVGGIAMQGTPIAGIAHSHSPPLGRGAGRAPLPPAGYSTPGGKAPLGSNKPPVGANAKHTPPSSSSGIFGTTPSGYGPGSSTVASSAQNSVLSMEEVLLNALVGDDEDSDNDDSMYYGGGGGAGGTGVRQVGLASAAQCADGYEFGAFLDAQHQQLQLREGDWVVQVNTLCTIAHSVATLQGLVAQGRDLALIYDTTGLMRGAGGKRSRPIDILMQELRACQAMYTALLDGEARQLARWAFLSQIQYPLHRFCMMRFDITGQEMEDRAAESTILGIMRRCLGITAVERYHEQQEGLSDTGAAARRTNSKPGLSSISPTGSAPSSSGGGPPQPAQGASGPGGAEELEAELQRQQREAERARHGAFLFGCESKLSQGAYVVVLRELCAVLAAYLMKHLLLRARFSEWGALLLHQEVIEVTQYAELLVDHLDPVNIQTVKATFAALNLALKVLTLDSPGDIRRYALNRALLSEEQVRAVLGRRTEFPAEAVAKVKLNMVDMADPPPSAAVS